MNVSINVEIDGRMNQLSVTDALKLYLELDKVFGQNNHHEIYNPAELQKAPIREPRAKHKINEKGTVRKASSGSEIPVSDIDNLPEEVKDKYSNPRVEAAKKRAAVRTSGCGARR